VILTMHLLGVVCHLKARMSYSLLYPYAKYGDSSFDHGRDITGAPIFKVGHVLLTFLSRVSNSIPILSACERMLIYRPYRILSCTASEI